MQSIHYRLGALLVTVLAAGMVQAENLAAVAASAIEKAEAARQKADSVNGEWRDTNEMIQKAKAAAQAGNFSSARDLANQAHFQGERGYQQAMQQKNAGFPAYLR
ncbi:conserved exported hypothetical protein [Gammaproteobacteria bacterium]